MIAHSYVCFVSGGGLTTGRQRTYKGASLAIAQQRPPVQQRRGRVPLAVVGHPSQGAAQQCSPHGCLQAPRGRLQERRRKGRCGIFRNLHF